MLIEYKGNRPKVADNVFLAEGVMLIGKVTIEDFSSVWFNTVLRGDIEPIYIGKGTNIQDLSVIHTNYGQPVIIEDNVSIGHSCVLHGCTIRKGCLIGMGSIIMNDAEIGENSLVGAGSLIPEKKLFPPNSLILGSPAKVIRELTAQEIESLHDLAQRYEVRSQDYLGS